MHVDEGARMRAAVRLHDIRAQHVALAHAEAEARLVLAAAIMGMDEALAHEPATTDVLRGEPDSVVSIRARLVPDVPQEVLTVDRGLYDELEDEVVATALDSLRGTGGP